MKRLFAAIILLLAAMFPVQAQNPAEALTKRIDELMDKQMDAMLDIIDAMLRNQQCRIGQKVGADCARSEAACKQHRLSFEKVDYLLKEMSLEIKSAQGISDDEREEMKEGQLIFDMMFFAVRTEILKSQC